MARLYNNTKRVSANISKRKIQKTPFTKKMYFCGLIILKIRIQ